MEESIYNIIPKQRPWTAKEPRYQSKFPPNVPPSYSTFNVGTTSKPGVHGILDRSRTQQGNFMRLRCHIHLMERLRHWGI